MSYLALYVVTVVVFLGADALWLRTVAGPMFRARLGDMMLENPRLGVAAAFYAFYCVGVVYFAAAPAAGDPAQALVDGALLGLFCYGAYEATNLATLKRWTPGMAALDTAWGAALTGVSASLAVWIAG